MLWKNFRITPYIHYACRIINYVCALLFLKTINSLRYWIYTWIITTYCMNKRGFFCVVFSPFPGSILLSFFSSIPPRLLTFQKIYIKISFLVCLIHVSRSTKKCIAFLHYWLPGEEKEGGGGGEGIIYLFLPVASTCSESHYISYRLFLNCARFWRITTSAYSGARNTTCCRRQLCVYGKIVVINCRWHDELHREMGTNDDVRDEYAMVWHQCARTHGFQHPVTSSKAT